MEKEFTVETNISIDENIYRRAGHRYFDLEYEALLWFDGAGVPEGERVLRYFVTASTGERVEFDIGNVNGPDDLIMAIHEQTKNQPSSVTAVGLIASYK
jgi:hypothetical protein